MDSKDRLSALPEPILHHILSFFDQRSAIRTCVLSKSWRYLWCTRPDIDIYEVSTDAGKQEALFSFLDRTLQGYRDRNLRLHSFSLWMPEARGDAPLRLKKLIPIIIQNMGVEYFELVFISERIDMLVEFELELPSSDSLGYMAFVGCSLQSTHQVHFSNLHTLGLFDVCIPEELLDSILSSPSIKYVHLSCCMGFTRINCSHQHLTNLSRLEMFTLDQCVGITEFNLSSASLKRLDIDNVNRPFKVTVDAPGIVSFCYRGILPQSVSFATTYDHRHWKSNLNLTSSNEPLYSFSELKGLLKALSQSEIFLDQIRINDDWFDNVVVTNNSAGVSEAYRQLPVVLVEHLTIERSWQNSQPSSSAADFLSNLFRMFRPSFIRMDSFAVRDTEHQGIVELLFKEREIESCYFWQSVLEEASLQVLHRHWLTFWPFKKPESEWQPFRYTSLPELLKKLAASELNHRIHLKWGE